jgi:TATA-box binding protein (TBP) (component of TFIID and TFIIIB)
MTTKTNIIVDYNITGDTSNDIDDYISHYFNDDNNITNDEDDKNFVSYPYAPPEFSEELEFDVYLNLPKNPYQLRPFVESLGFSTDDFLVFPESYYFEKFEVLSRSEYTTDKGLKISIPNIVERIDLDKPGTSGRGYSLNLKKIINHMRDKGPTHNQQKFSSVVFKYKHPLNCTLLIFNSGTIICTGAKQQLISLLTLEYTLFELRKIPSYSDISVGSHTVRNIVGHGIVPFRIDLPKFINNTGARYDKSKFAGAIYQDIWDYTTDVVEYEDVDEMDNTNDVYKMISLLFNDSNEKETKKTKRKVIKTVEKKSKITCLVFSNGQFVILGARTHDMLNARVSSVYDLLLKAKQVNKRKNKRRNSVTY